MVDAEMLERVLDLVHAEVYRATELHGPFHGPHEGFAVLLEEVDELWDEVKANDAGKAWQEAIQVAAMAVRFLIDCAPAPLKERLTAPMCLLPTGEWFVPAGWQDEKTKPPAKLIVEVVAQGYNWDHKPYTTVGYWNGQDYWNSPKWPGGQIPYVRMWRKTPDSKFFVDYEDKPTPTPTIPMEQKQ